MDYLEYADDVRDEARRSFTIQLALKGHEEETDATKIVERAGVFGSYLTDDGAHFTDVPALSSILIGGIDRESIIEFIKQWKMKRHGS